MSDSIEREIDSAVENRVSDADIETTLRSDSGKLRRVMELGAFEGKVFFLTAPDTGEPMGSRPWYGKVIGPDPLNEGRHAPVWSGSYAAESGAVEAVKEKLKQEHEHRKRRKEMGLIEEQRNVEAGGWYDDDGDEEEMVKNSVREAVETQLSSEEVEMVFESDSGKLRRVMELGAWSAEITHLSAPDGREMEPAWMAKVLDHTGRAVWSNSYETESGAVEGGMHALLRKRRQFQHRSETLEKSGSVHNQQAVRDALVRRADEVIDQARGADTCAESEMALVSASALYTDFVDAASNGRVNPDEIGAGTPIAEVGNAWTIARRELHNNGCISSEEAGEMNDLHVRNHVRGREYDEARERIRQGLDIALA